MYDYYFLNFGRPPVPNHMCKDSATRHPRFWRRRNLKVFTIYGHGSHLGQWTANTLAISILCPREAPNEIWAILAQRRSHLKFWTFFPYKCIGKQTWPCCKKSQMSIYDHYFSNFGWSPIPDDLCKDSATRRSWFWRRRFLKVFTYMGRAAILVNGPWPFK